MKRRLAGSHAIESPRHECRRIPRCAARARCGSASAQIEPDNASGDKMSLPDFTKLDLAADLAAPSPPPGEPWLTPEGIAVKTVYAAGDRAGLDFVDGLPGLAPFGRG